MGRIISWPVGIGITHREPLAGPRAAGAASTEGLTGWVQTTASAYGAWRWSFALPPLRGTAFRRWRGTVAALHGGANLLAVQFADPDMMSYAEAGVVASAVEIAAGRPWSFGGPWAGGGMWRVSRPLVRVAVAAEAGETIVRLSGDFWGGDLDIGDEFGFVGVFALHEVTQRISAGVYRVWPPLRAAVTPNTYATLKPIMAVKLEGETSAPLPRGVSHAEGLAVTAVEVQHDTVVEYFT